MTVVLWSHRRYIVGRRSLHGEEMHTLIKFMVRVVASNTVDGFFNPLIDLIH